MEEFLKSLQEIDPLWSVVLVAAALAVLLIAKFWSASFIRVAATAVVLAAIGGVAAAAYYGFQYFEDTRRLEERRALDERAKLLFGQTVQPDSVFACIDGSPVPAVLDACEKSLFAEPQRVAAAVAIVTQRLAYLADALAFIEKRDADYSGRLEPLRKSIEADPYGFVAFVLSVEHGCAVEACVRFSLFRAPERVKENMRVRRLEAFLARYSAAWRDGSSPAVQAVTPPAASVGRSVAPLVTISGGETQTQPQPAAAETPQTAAQPPAPEAPAAPTAGVTVSEPPAAALAPTITPPAEGEGFAASKRETAATESALPPAQPTASQSPAAAKSAVRPPAQAKAKAKAEAKAADPVTRRTNEPVAGLPRIVPRDYIREKEEEKEDPKAQVSGQQPGAPMQLSPPAQNFIGR
jgi:hypothetical protein